MEQWLKARSRQTESALGDFGIRVPITFKSDASAAVGITQRLGLGKVRHLAVSDLWMQGGVRDGSIVIEKVPGEDNVSDLMTKGLDRTRIDKLLRGMNVDCLESYSFESTEGDYHELLGKPVKQRGAAGEYNRRAASEEVARRRGFRGGEEQDV